MPKRFAKQFLNRVIKHLQNLSSPSIIQQILNDLKLDSFEIRDEGFNNFLFKLKNEPIDLSGIIQAVETGLLTNPPIQYRTIGYVISIMRRLRVICLSMTIVQLGPMENPQKCSFWVRQASRSAVLNAFQAHIPSHPHQYLHCSF